MSITTVSERALLRSESGPGAGMALSAAPSNFHNRIDSHFSECCSSADFVSACLHLLASADVAVHTTLSAIIAQHARGLESLGDGSVQLKVRQPMCREAGGRVVTNVSVRGFEIASLADGLPLFGDGAVCSGHHIGFCSPLRRHCHSGCSRHRWCGSGWSEETQGEILPRTGPVQSPGETHSTGRREVAGQWSDETRNFSRQLARTRARDETKLMRRRVEQAWRRWWTMLSCAVARAFSASLLGMRSSRGSDGQVPSSDDVVGEFRRAGMG